ncbi:hypothetical protein IMCC9480_766 [Oxalobacteraceae bacterium IMCC9480]|nr:hypothetical protein IMCC9480_766 [Oxalobacteraceae bacterium IMCC9480]
MRCGLLARPTTAARTEDLNIELGYKALYFEFLGYAQHHG